MGGASGTRDVLVYSQEPYSKCGLAQWVSCSRMVVSAGDMKNVQLCGVGVPYTWGCWCTQGGGQKESEVFLYLGCSTCVWQCVPFTH